MGLGVGGNDSLTFLLFQLFCLTLQSSQLKEIVMTPVPTTWYTLIQLLSGILSMEGHHTNTSIIFTTNILTYYYLHTNTTYTPLQ